MRSSYVILLICLSLLALGAEKSSGFFWFPPPDEEPGIILTIDEASYCALEEDGLEDDILTIFTMKSATGRFEIVTSFILLELTLPSGNYYFTYIYLWAIYFELTLQVKWFNCATESGWYTFSVLMSSIGIDWSSILEQSVDFDPPKEGPPGATPFVELDIIC